MHATAKLIGGLSTCFALAASVALVTHSVAAQDKDKNTVKVPGGIGFADFKGYEGWQTVATSRNEKAMAVILANPVMIAAFQAGVPGNGKPFPDGSKMAKIHWVPKKNANFPDTSVPGALHDVDFMEKDAKRFADSGGWGYGAFEYDSAAEAFTPATQADSPPQANDAKCGFACHTIVQTRDYVFTEYAKR